MRRIIGIVLIGGWVAANVAAVDYERFSQSKRLAIRSVRPDRAQVEVYQRLTIDIDLEASYENAFDRRQIRVDVSSIGKDWLMVNAYRIPGIVQPKVPPLRVLGVAGATRVLLWLQSPDYTWSSARRTDFDPYVVTNGRLTLKNLAPGRWVVEHWNTHAGQVTDTVTAETDAAGRLAIELLPITWDCALRLKQQ